MSRKPSELKRALFVRLAERRTTSVLEKLRILGNCANRYAYEWTEADVMAIFGAIRDETDRAQLRFEATLRDSPKFSLATMVLETARPYRVSLKPEDAVGQLEHRQELPMVREGRSNHVRSGTSSGQAEQFLFAQPDSDPSRENPNRIADVDIVATPVPGSERSQVVIRLITAPDWYVLAKDKGHRLGYSLHLYGPDSVQPQRKNSGRGTLRGHAIRVAAEMIADASAATSDTQMTFDGALSGDG
jgi:hypothetical protein